MLVKYNRRGTRIVKVDNFYDFALKQKKRPKIKATTTTTTKRLLIELAIIGVALPAMAARSDLFSQHHH